MINSCIGAIRLHQHVDKLSDSSCFYLNKTIPRGYSLRNRMNPADNSLPRTLPHSSPHPSDLFYYHPNLLQLFLHPQTFPTPPTRIITPRTLPTLMPLSLPTRIFSTLLLLPLSLLPVRGRAPTGASVSIPLISLYSDCWRLANPRLMMHCNYPHTVLTDSQLNYMREVSGSTDLSEERTISRGNIAAD